MFIRKVIKGVGFVPLIIIGSLLVYASRFSVSTSADLSLINADYPYFKITFNVDE